jgi:hypothetical protein
MAKRGLIISTGTAGSGVNSYIDLENRPDDIIDTTVIPATTTGTPTLRYMAKSILPYVVLGASDALDNPNINLLFSIVSLKLIYPSPFILSVEKVEFIRYKGLEIQ